MMNAAGKSLRFVRPVLLSAVLLMSAGASFAADAPKSTPVPPPKDVAAAPDPYDNPALAGLLKTGAKAFFLGQRSGINGWLLMKDGQIQTGYTPPSGGEVVVGMMYGSDGESVTAIQLGKLVETNPEVAAVLKDKLAIKDSPTSQTPAAANTESPGEKLFKDMSASAGVVLGSAAAPQVMMVMDTTCRHCRASWTLLRDYVTKGIIQLRMVPVANMDSESERSAAVLLKSADPMTAWNKYVTGDATALAGTPQPDAVTALRANHAMVDRWKIDATPYFVYRAKTGEVKIIKGEIEKVDTLLADVVP